VSNISLQRKSKWQKRKTSIVKKVEPQLEETMKRNADYWDQLALPRYKPTQRKPKLKDKVMGKTQRQRKNEKDKQYKIAYREADKRDKHTCQFPGCNCKIIEHHHGRFRSQGGLDRVEELVDLCWKHHKGTDESPHKSEYWRDHWEDWLANLYPEYWAKIRESQQIKVCGRGT
jgi:hypothetical protein